MKRCMIDRSAVALFSQGEVKGEERKQLLEELNEAPASDATRHENNPHDCLALALAARHILVTSDMDAVAAKELMNRKALFSVPMQVEWGRDDKTGDPWSLDIITSHEACMEDEDHFHQNHNFMRTFFADVLPADFFSLVGKPTTHPHQLECEAQWRALPEDLPGSWNAFFNKHFDTLHRYEHLDTLRLVKTPGKGKENNYSSQLTLAHSCPISSVDKVLPVDSSGFVWIVQPTPPNAELFSLIALYISDNGGGVEYVYPSEGIVARGMQQFLTTLDLEWSPCKTVFFLPFRK